MKLYMHPASPPSRAINLLIAEKVLPIESVLVDLKTGAHHQEPYISINPNRLVPLLEDGDFRLTEGSAIIKYLGDKFDLAEYPKELKARARVNEMLDWVNSNLYRDYGYNMIYPQIMGHHKRDEAAQAGTLEWGKTKSLKWLQLLNDHWLGDKKPYLCGNNITIADYFAGGVIALGELVGCDLAEFANITRWMGNMRKLKHWDEMGAATKGWAEHIGDKARFVRIA
jgi:glutathione S-transferase